MQLKSINDLASIIVTVHNELQQQAVSAVNKMLTMRNWLIGNYIVEFEQGGKGSAEYGSSLMESLTKELAKSKLKNISAPELRRFRKFYLTYPLFYQAFNSSSIRGTLSHKFIEESIRGTASHELQKVDRDYISLLWQKLSFSHLSELIKIDDNEKRKFYEQQCIQGVWSLRELKRQIASLYYERSGLSTNPEKLQQIVNDNSYVDTNLDWIRNPMIFEFLDLPNKEAVLEKDLENALLDNLEQFLLELGNGFCFEARQKRIIIDDEYYFVDLVFYHRILKCHVLIELKNDVFTHENAGQLDVYLQYYKNEVMAESDNPPIGILLCTDSKKTMVKYATVNKDQLLVSNYKVNLPTKEKLEAFIKDEIRKNG